MQANAHAVAPFPNVTVPFRPDRNILALVFMGVCDTVSPAGGAELPQSTGWVWSRVLEGELPGLRSSRLQLGQETCMPRRR